MKTNERLPEPEEPFFATEQDFQKAVNKFYEEWRNRPKWEATTGFDEWKVAQLVQARARLDEVVTAARAYVKDKQLIDNFQHPEIEAELIACLAELEKVE